MAIKIQGTTIIDDSRNIINSTAIGIGTTNPTSNLHVVPTSTSIAGLFSGTTSSDMVRITQTGTGNALVVEDETSPDSTPFVVKADGSVGIGTTNPTSNLQLIGTLSIGSLGNALQITSTELSRSNGGFIMRGGGNQSTRNSIELTNGVGLVIDGGSGETYGVELKGGGGPVKVTQGNLLVGTSAITGTASQLLQVNSGAYVSGDIGIGTTTPSAKLTVNPSSTGIAGLFSGTTSSDMVRITQTGTGNALVVEDETNPDSTPFVVKADGSVGLGTITPSAKLDVRGGIIVSGISTISNKLDIGYATGTSIPYTPSTLNASATVLESSSLIKDLSKTINLYVQWTNVDTATVDVSILDLQSFSEVMHVDIKYSAYNFNQNGANNSSNARLIGRVSNGFYLSGSTYTAGTQVIETFVNNGTPSWTVPSLAIRAIGGSNVPAIRFSRQNTTTFNYVHYFMEITFVFSQ